MFLFGLREAFEFLTDNDPEMRIYVTDRISMEWGQDHNPQVSPPLLEPIERDAEEARLVGTPPKLDLGGFVHMCRIRLEKQTRSIAERHGEKQDREHIMFLRAYREAFEVLTDDDPELRKYATSRVPEMWGTDG
ncbi:MAG: hypothetical protein QM589_18575 [Thermomicrobiales bacterium]